MWTWVFFYKSKENAKRGKTNFAGKTRRLNFADPQSWLFLNLVLPATTRNRIRRKQRAGLALAELPGLTNS